MLAQGLKFFTDIPMTSLALLIFIFVFGGVLAWTFLRAGSRKFYEQMANLPLIEE